MARNKDAFDGETVETTERQESSKVEKVEKEEFTTEEIFRAGKFTGVRMTHTASGVNIFRELRRGQHVPDREMKLALKKMLAK